MLALTLDMLPLPYSSESVIAYRHEATIQPWAPSRHDDLRVRYLS